MVARYGIKNLANLYRNSWVAGQLEDEGRMTSAELAKRAKMSPRKLNKLAIKIMDEWEAKKEIKSLYDTFKSTLNTARQATVNDNRFKR